MHPVRLIALLLAFLMGAVQAQEKSTYTYWERYDIARLQIASHHASRAIRTLEQLRREDSTQVNVAYLLSVAYIIKNTKNAEAIRNLEFVDANFHDLKAVSGVSPPAHLYYYMVLAYTRANRCQDAYAALARFETLTDRSDEYYITDGRKWAGLCNEPTAQLAAPKERIVQRKVETRPLRYSTGSRLYGVQVAALLQPQLTSRLEGLSNIEVFVDNEGVFRYVIGNFIYRSQAEKLLESIKAKDYPDAFVVEITDADLFPLEVVSVDQRSLKAPIAGPISFRVQLAAFREPLPELVARFYLEIEGIEQMRYDDLTLLLVGHWASYDEATAFRDSLHAKGFGDAFIIAIEGGRKLPLEDALLQLGIPIEGPKK
jgi:hypothetical protein